jgi:penicillin-binding protein 1A
LSGSSLFSSSIKNYLNTVSFGGTLYGIKSAAKQYFNKSPDSLNVQESAVLVGMLKAPTRYNPVKRPEKATTRRNVVLTQMAKYDKLDAATADSLKALPLEVDYFNIADHNAGLARYFREHLRVELRTWCKENGYDLYKDGVKIYTTIDSRYQELAEKAVKEHLADIQDKFFDHWSKRDPWGKNTKYVELAMRQSHRYKRMKLDGASKDSIRSAFDQPVPMKIFTWAGEKDTVMTPWDSLRHYKFHLQAGFMLMEPGTGHIRAWVGGADYRYFKYDHVTSQRQIGSTFKPFVYSVAVSEGMSPCEQMPNIPFTFEAGPEHGLQESWTPKNSDNKFKGEWLTMQKGLCHSVNIIAARTMARLKPAVVVQRVKRMGVKSEIPPYPSICLGTPDISVFEMVGAYGTFINDGFYREPVFISHIEDKHGNIIPGFIPDNEEAMDKQTAHIMVKMLRGVIDSGTGIGLRYRYKIKSQMAGKTGTTQEHADGWFMGFSPQLVGGVWVGGDDRTVRFRTINLGQGARLALPIFGKFFQAAYADSTLGIDPDIKFPEPEFDLNVETDCEKYVQPGKSNRGEYGDYFEGL